MSRILLSVKPADPETNTQAHTVLLPMADPISVPGRSVVSKCYAGLGLGQLDSTPDVQVASLQSAVPQFLLNEVGGEV